MELGVGGCGGDFACYVFVRRFVSWISFLLSFLRLFLFFFFICYLWMEPRILEICGITTRASCGARVSLSTRPTDGRPRRSCIFGRSHRLYLFSSTYVQSDFHLSSLDSRSSRRSSLIQPATTIVRTYIFPLLSRQRPSPPSPRAPPERVSPPPPPSTSATTTAALASSF